MICQCDFLTDYCRAVRCGSPATKFFRNSGGVSKQNYARCDAHMYRIERTRSFEPLTREEYVVACVMEC